MAPPRIGEEIPSLVKDPITRIQLVKYAGASGDFNPIHLIEEEAVQKGLKGVIAHGMLSMAFIGQMVSDWLERHGYIRNLKVRFKSQVFPGDTITCRGVVERVDPDADGWEVELRVWAENQDGAQVTAGSATVWLSNNTSQDSTRGSDQT